MTPLAVVGLPPTTFAVTASAPSPDFRKATGPTTASLPYRSIFAPPRHAPACLPNFTAAPSAASLAPPPQRPPPRPKNNKFASHHPRLDEGVDCSQRPAPGWMSGGDADGTGDAGDGEDMGDFMAEILAEEVRVPCGCVAAFRHLAPSRTNRSPTT